MSDQYRIHAEFCRAIASPKRLHILDLLRQGPMTVSELAEALRVSASNVSQHLTVLKQHGVILGERHGTAIAYRLTHPELLKAYDLMHEVMRRLQQERIEDLGDQES